MAFIKVISPETAEGRLAKIYRRVRSAGGQVDNVLQVHSLRPHSLEGHMGLYKATLHHSRNVLPEWYLEAIGVMVSRLNGCDYCARHHAAGMRRQLEQSGLDAAAYMGALALDAAGKPFTGREQLGLSYARKLTHCPGEVGEADIGALRSAGFTDGEILEINQVAAYFAYANRTVTGLGVTIDGEVLGQSPSTGENDSEWEHG